MPNYDRRATVDDTFTKWYESLSSPAIQRLRAMDDAFVGTPNYMGIVYFWNIEYKFSLRDAPPSKRIEVHNAFLKAGLDVSGVSSKHAAILRKFGLGF